MLRSLVLALLIVNLGFFAWAHGWLKAWAGMPAEGQREPQRLSAQLHAEQIEVLQPGDITRNHALRRHMSQAEAASAPASAASTNEGAKSTPTAASQSRSDAQQADSNTTLCVEAGPFINEDATNVDKALRPLLPQGSWTRQSIAIGGQWMVYMGPYNDENIYDRKISELKRIKGLNFDEVRTGTYARGVSLGRFASETDAETRLSGLKQRGIRTARVVTIRPAGQVHYLRVAQANESIQVTLSGLKLPQGKSFTACRS